MTGKGVPLVTCELFETRHVVYGGPSANAARPSQTGSLALFLALLAVAGAKNL